VICVVLQESTLTCAGAETAAQAQRGKREWMHKVKNRPRRSSRKWEQVAGIIKMGE
jgi:hypothetical protein